MYRPHAHGGERCQTPNGAVITTFEVLERFEAGRVDDG